MVILIVQEGNWRYAGRQRLRENEASVSESGTGEKTDCFM